MFSTPFRHTRSTCHGTMCALALLLSIGTLVAGCGGDDSDEDTTTASGLQITLTRLPPDAGPTTWLFLQQCDGTLCQDLAQGQGNTAEYGTVGVNAVETTPFDVTLYIPSDAGWDPSQPMADGYYAGASGLTEPAGSLWVSFWERRDGPPQAASSVLAATASADFATVEGTITDEDGGPLSGLSVWIETVALSGTDDQGAFTLRDVPRGMVTLHVAGPGVTETTTMVDTSTDPMPVLLPVSFDPDAALETERVLGTVVDQNTGSPLTGVFLTFADGTTTTSDAQGHFDVNVAAGTGHVSLALDGYGLLTANIGSYCQDDGNSGLRFELAPLPEDFYGTWSFCYERVRDGDHIDPMDGVDEQRIWTFGADGRADLQPDDEQWDWNALESPDGGEWHVVSARPSPWCSAWYSGSQEIYRWWEVDGEHLVHVSHPSSVQPGSDNGDVLIYYSQDPSTDPDCEAGTDTPPDDTVALIRAALQDWLSAQAGTHPLQCAVVKQRVDSGPPDRCSDDTSLTWREFTCDGSYTLTIDLDGTLTINGYSVSLTAEAIAASMEANDFATQLEGGGVTWFLDGLLMPGTFTPTQDEPFALDNDVYYFGLDDFSGTPIQSSYPATPLVCCYGDNCCIDSGSLTCN